jgi:hypothetical protein
MNIQKLISKVRVAKKRRLINNFHLSPKSGVDVENEEFQSVLLLLKDMFKWFKANNCNIQVSSYGEIYITLIELGHSFELSIANRPCCIDIKNADTHLIYNPFIKFIGSTFENQLTVSVKTTRKKSEWKHYRASEFGIDGILFAELVIKDMNQRVKHYSTDDDLFILEQPTRQDILAVIHLGGATLVNSSMLYHLSKSIRQEIYVSKIMISANSVIISDSLGIEITQHFFGDREAKFFSQYLLNY